jgi:hypothetical protein
MSPESFLLTHAVGNTLEVAIAIEFASQIL